MPVLGLFVGLNFDDLDPGLYALLGHYLAQARQGRRMRRATFKVEKGYLHNRLYPFLAALLIASRLLLVSLSPGNAFKASSNMVIARWCWFDPARARASALRKRRLAGSSAMHSGWLEPEEVAVLARRKPSLVCAPSSSLHNGYGNFLVGKLPELMALGANVALGSDHASSGIVDMAQEMRLAACCYKETRINPRVMPPEAAIEMATINGARAVQLADRIGSIEVGKEADIVLFDSHRPEWQPLLNPVANLVYSATGDSVRDVFVAGEHVVRGGRIVRFDEDDLYREIPSAVARFGGRLKLDKMIQLRWPVS